MVSVDRLKPAFLEDPIHAALPPACGRPVLRPALHAPDPSLSSTTSAAVPSRGSVQKSVRFQLPPPVPTRQNPHRTAREMDLLRRSFAVPSGGSTVADPRFSDLPLSIIIC